MSQKLDNDQMNRLWEHGLHEETMFVNKLNFFLVFESVLLGVVGLLYSRPVSAKLVLISIICLGLLLTILWGYVQAEQQYFYNQLRSFIKDELPEYQISRVRLEQAKWRISPTFLLTYGVPILVGLIWVVLLLSVALT